MPLLGFQGCGCLGLRIAHLWRDALALAADDVGNDGVGWELGVASVCGKQMSASGVVTPVLPSALSGTSMVDTPVPQVQIHMLANSLIRAICHRKK